jgi:hypothetical protein
LKHGKNTTRNATFAEAKKDRQVRFEGLISEDSKKQIPKKDLVSYADEKRAQAFGQNCTKKIASEIRDYRERSKGKLL